MQIQKITKTILFKGKGARENHPGLRPPLLFKEGSYVYTVA
jgi:hypothetical protein